MMIYEKRKLKKNLQIYKQVLLAANFIKRTMLRMELLTRIYGCHKK